MNNDFLMTLEEWYEKYHKRCNKCIVCGKVYKLPNYINKPRDMMCFSCELVENVKNNLMKAFEAMGRK